MDVVEWFSSAANAVVTAIVEEFEEAVNNNNSSSSDEFYREPAHPSASASARSGAENVNVNANASGDADGASVEIRKAAIPRLAEAIMSAVAPLEGNTLAFKENRTSDDDDNDYNDESSGGEDGWNDGFSSIGSEFSAAGGTSFMEASIHSSVSHDAFQYTETLVRDLDAARNIFLNRYARLRLRSESVETPMPQWQITHAKTIIQAVPALDQLRFELCPSHIPDRMFWRVYFSLVKEHQTLPAPKEVAVKIEADQTPSRKRSRHDSEPWLPSGEQISLDAKGNTEEAPPASDEQGKNHSSGAILENYFPLPPSPPQLPPATEQEKKRARCDMSPLAKPTAVASVEFDQDWLVVGSKEASLSPPLHPKGSEPKHAVDAVASGFQIV